MNIIGKMELAQKKVDRLSIVFAGVDKIRIYLERMSFFNGVKE